MKKATGILLLIAVAALMLMVTGCPSGKTPGGAAGGDAIVGKWGKVENPATTVTISKEGDKYFYEGSQGKNPAIKKDANTLKVPMGGITVNVSLEPASGVLTVAFMGEKYQYKKVQ